ncbi:MAG: hypothetical protein AAGD92_05645 [Pseudomonadota bacterium]
MTMLTRCFIVVLSVTAILIGRVSAQPSDQNPNQPDQPDQPSFGQQFFEALRESAASPRVAIINAVIAANNGEAVGEARVRRVRVINSYAPKAFARDQGEWAVSLYCFELCGNAISPVYRQNETYTRGQRAFRNQWPDPVAGYRIVNPLHDIEREAPVGSEFLFEPVRWDGPYPWELIVPLYDNTGSIEADWVFVTDIRSGAVVLRAQIIDAPAQDEQPQRDVDPQRLQ